MNRIVIIAIVMACIGISSSCDMLPNELTTEEIVEGLKKALTIGAENSSASAHETNGFYSNPIMDIRIPLPTEVQNMVDALSFLDNLTPALQFAAQSIIGSLNVKELAADFLLGINRAAEAAAGGAFNVFADAILGMGIADGLAILNGVDTAATHYLRVNTTTGLRGVFLPVVNEAMLSVEVVTKYWEPLATNYNSFHSSLTNLLSSPLINNPLTPGLKDELSGHLSGLPAPIGDTNFDSYITGMAINGLMSLIGDQEMKIRADPFAWGSSIIEKVFGRNK